MRTGTASVCSRVLLDSGRLNSRLALEVGCWKRSLDVAVFGATAVLLGLTYTPLATAERDESEDDSDTASSRHKYAESLHGRESRCR